MIDGRRWLIRVNGSSGSKVGKAEERIGKGVDDLD